MDIVKELTRLHELAGETTVLNFRALMQNELRKLIEQAQEEAAQQSFAPDALPCEEEKCDKPAVLFYCEDHAP